MSESERKAFETRVRLRPLTMVDFDALVDAAAEVLPGHEALGA